MADPTPAPIKPAYKTTEGWLNFATGLLGALVAAHFIGDGGQVATVAGLAISFAAALSHTWSRTTLKAQHMIAGAPS